MRKILILTFILLVWLNSALALDLPTIKTFTDPNTNKVVAIVNNEASKDQSFTTQSAKTRNIMSAQEKESRSIQASDKFLLEKGNILGIKNVSSELYPSEVTTDSIGTTVVRNAQRYNGVNVYGAEIITVLNSRLEVLSTNGRFLEGINLETNPNINSLKVVKLATRDMEKRYGWKRILSVEKRAARKFCRENSNPSLCVNKKLKKFKKAKGFYSLKAPELFIYNEKYLLGEIGGENHLAWNLVMVGDSDISDAYFIDAHTGQVLSAQGTARELNRKIYDCSNPKGDGLCWSNLHPAIAGYPSQYIPYTFGRIEGAPERLGHPMTAFLGTTETDKAYDITELVHNYINTKFGRNGANNQGGTGNGTAQAVTFTYVRVNYNGTNPITCSTTSAQWDPTKAEINLCVGSADSDTISHEYSHAFAYYLNKLQTISGQPGSLDESHADVFGQIFEASVAPSFATDWIAYEGSTTEVIRNISNPGSAFYTAAGQPIPYPDNYNSPTYWCGSGGNYGRHVNSTVPSFAAYLASEGGFNNGCTIQGIGKAKVEQIWYRALSTYYSNSTTFFEAQQKLIQSCGDLVGNPTPQMVTLGINITAEDCNSVARALQSVEMDKPGGCNGEVPKNLDLTPTCLDLPPDYSGDFNADSVVDLWDYNVLRQQWGNTGAGHSADANLDNLVDINDYNIWLEDYSGENPPPAPTITGDCDYDSDVDGADFLAWQRSFGLTGPGIACDLNVDGTVDAADYTVWRDNYGSGSQ